MVTFTNGTIGEGVLMIRICFCIVNMREQKREYDYHLDVEAGK